MIGIHHKRTFRKLIKKLQRSVNRPWYFPLLLVFALLDALLIIIPTDGILISSSMLLKKKWLPFAMCVAIGSAIGAMIIVYFVEFYGIEFLQLHYPSLFNSKAWTVTNEFFKNYGLIVLFLVGVTPFTQQPALVLAALSKGDLVSISIIVLISRVIKFCIMAYIASHAPRLINKLWGLRSEVKEMDITIKG